LAEVLVLLVPSLAKASAMGWVATNEVVHMLRHAVVLPELLLRQLR